MPAAALPIAWADAMQRLEKPDTVHDHRAATAP
jgi:hypothetical protein